MNNSVFGKTIENLRKRVIVTLINDSKKLLKHASKSTFISCKIFNENLVAIYKIKESLTLNRPAYVEMCILDISKTLMYDFHYNYIKEKYGSNAKFLFTDTDLLTYNIRTEDIMYINTFGLIKTNLISVIIIKFQVFTIQRMRK